MKRILRFLFNRYRDDFDDFFIADLFQGIPKEVSENALKFMLTGKKQLDLYFRHQAYVIQRKLERPTNQARSYIGGLVFIQILDTALARLENEKRLMPNEEEAKEIPKTLEDNLKGVDEFFEHTKVEDIQS